MTSVPPATSRLNASCPSWLAVWQWSAWGHWTIGAFALLSPVVYFFSYVPVRRLIFAYGLDDTPVMDTARAIYAPIDWSMAQSPLVTQFMSAYWDFCAPLIPINQ